MRHSARALGLLLFPSLLLTGVSAATSAGTADDYPQAMSHEHAGDEPVAAAAADAPGEDGLQISRPAYAKQGDREVLGYLASPAEPRAGILVIHEWWGLNDNVEAMARKLAAAGYAALAVDLYGGEVAETPETARALMQGAMNSSAQTEDNLHQAYRFLEENKGLQKIGVIGWCFGGGWSLRTAVLLPEKIDATVIYYGRLIDDPEQLRPIRSPILGLFGADDGGIPVDSVRAFETLLAELGKTADIRVYDGAGHAFANPSGTRYKKEAAEDAWARTLAFFAEHLQPSGV